MHLVYHNNVKTVAKWRKRTSVEDLPMSSHEPHSTVLTVEQEAIIVAFVAKRFCRWTIVSTLYRPNIPNLTRSSLHHCLKRHGISRLPEIAGEKITNKKFKQYPIGYFHIDIAEVCTKEGRLYLFVAIDRTSKFAYAQRHADQTRDTACRFLRQLIAVVSYHIYTILTDNGIQFTNRQTARRRTVNRFRST